MPKVIATVVNAWRDNLLVLHMFVLFAELRSILRLEIGQSKDFWKNLRSNAPGEHADARNEFLLQTVYLTSQVVSIVQLYHATTK